MMNKVPAGRCSKTTKHRDFTSYRTIEMRAIQMIGIRFSRLTVQREIPGTSPKKFDCLCDCGNTIVTHGSLLRAGKTVSCGCKRKFAAVTHGKSYSREYRIWNDMVRRCTDPKRQNWKYYGGRGISVCERWKSFETFLKDMGPSNGLTIERINNEGNYEPGNCRWATMAEQRVNRRCA